MSSNISFVCKCLSSLCDQEKKRIFCVEFFFCFVFQRSKVIIILWPLRFEISLCYYIWFKNFDQCVIYWDVTISDFGLKELDFVQFHHDIIFCLESDSIVLSFLSSTGFLRVDIHQIWFQHITCYFLPSCFHGVLLFLSTTYERELASTRTQIVA